MKTSSKQSETQRETAPTVHPAELAELVHRNSMFAFDLYQSLRYRARLENLFYSPYSISLALAMTYAGARGETERQMAETLQFTLPQERLHSTFNALDIALSQQGGEGFRLNIANSLWGQKDYTFLTDFLDTLAANYGAGLRLLDFGKEPELSRKLINDWVSQRTEDRIKDLIPPGGITSATRLTLANAIYFNAKWTQPFDKARTRDDVFHTLDRGQVTVPMMKMSTPTTLSYTRGSGYQAVELPYKGGQTSMLIVVPDHLPMFETSEAGLDVGQVRAIVGALESRQVALTMPKFKYESDTMCLSPTLSTMGMPDVFRDADFSGMTGDCSLFISEVFHKVFVAVDEAGTEAAAATAMGMIVATMSPSRPSIKLTVDRPFFFVIRDMKSGTVLFVGRVVNPG